MSQELLIIKRNGARVPFDKKRIFSAIEKAFLSENRVEPATVVQLTDEIVSNLLANLAEGVTATVEDVQDNVEASLMRGGHHRIAKNYILYRERHKQIREEEVLDKIKHHQLSVKVSDNKTQIFDGTIIRERLVGIGSDLKRVNIDEIVDAIQKQIYDNITKDEIELLVLGACRERIEKHYDYSALSSRIAINNLYKSVLNQQMYSPELKANYQTKFSDYIQKGLSEEMLNPKLADYDLAKMAKAIDPERDKLFYYLGVQILIDRYLLRDRSEKRAVYELPQWFWMRVAMGLAVLEENKEERAIEFYNVLSNMDLVSSTPTLFNSGTNFSQMSSCYINTVEDSLQDIFKLYGDNARLSKWAGGIGSDWTNVRATGSKIKGTNGMSQGIIPFIKIFNDVALAVNQGGKRKGAMCAYLELWHLDFEQFLELKKNTGDERRRAHDINTAAWVPDLFMKRVKENGKWTLFCPSDVPDLHDLYGAKFEARYSQYEAQNLPRSKTIQASDLWRKMLTMLFETGHPWITFKDPINLRSPQDHVGVVHSSNLCTEITLNTSKDETAVCNLASLNLAKMITNGKLDEAKIAETVGIGMRMLDNVIDNNFYPTDEAKSANLKHRAVGLGLMGYQDALYQLGINFDSEANIEFADASQEVISYYAIQASSHLAKERGSYSSFKGSKWDRGIFPFDTIALLEKERGQEIQVSRKTRLDWEKLKAHVKQYGMRNSNTMAIAPTATIANIAGVFPCTEPAYKNIYMKENLSGNFLVVNTYLVDALDKLGVWNDDVLANIKLNDGSVSGIREISESVRGVYKEIFEIDPYWIIKAAAHRGKWIDQSASTNVFIKTTSGKIISDIYEFAWACGLKTTYYLRTLGASQVTKATVNAVQSAPDSEPSSDEQSSESDVKACLINDPTCEACQ